MIKCLALAWGQPWSDGYWRHGHMADGGWFIMFFGPVLTLVVLAALAAVVILAVRGADRASQGRGPREQTPIDILKERFARGEIDKAEFEDRRRTLSE